MSNRNKCSLCKRPVAEEFRPFCSRGCRDKDLLNWFGEGYSVPGEPAAMPDPQDPGLN